MSTPGRLGIGIIGMGHVGPVIGSALRAVGHQIVAVSASSEASRERADAMLPGVPMASPEEVAGLLAAMWERVCGWLQGMASGLIL